MKLADVTKRILQEAKKPIENIAVGKKFKLNGKEYTVSSWDDSSVYATSGSNQPAAFLSKTLIAKGVTFEPSERKKVDRSGFISTATIPTRKYESLLKAAAHSMDGMGHSEAFDVAQSLIHDKDIYDYLSKRYPMLNKRRLIEKLTTDLEMWMK